MGQYYICANVTKKEYLYPLHYNNGGKLMEHSWQGNEIMNAAMNLLASRWKGDRIVWAGDYADEGIFVPIGEKENLYNYVYKHFVKIKDADTSNSTYQYILNLDEKRFVDLRKIPQNSYGWQIHPLSLLTASGNGRGSGDYHGKNEDLCGVWAGDRIAVLATVPEGYSELVCSFREW